MPYRSIDGVDYHYEIAGSGPTLVLLHGFTGSTENWSSHLPYLAARYRTIAIDLIGHGQTTAPASPDRYRIEQGAKDLATLFEEIVNEPVCLLGYSMGGRLALYTALTFPNQVHTLILESASPGLEDAEARRRRVTRDHALADRIETDGIEAFVGYWESVPLFASQQRLPDEVRKSLRRQRLKNRSLGLANSLRGMGTGAQPSLWSRLAQLSMPVHLVVGELDQMFVDINRRMAAHVQRAAASANLTVVPGAGHTVHLEQPDRFREIIVAIDSGDLR